VSNTELNVVVPNGAPSLGGGSSAPALIDIQSVEYTVDCLGNDDTFLENNASFPDEVRLQGNLEVVDGRTNPGATPPDFGPLLPGDQSEIWQAFMDLPPGPCTVQLRARDNDGEVICTATESFNITADTIAKVSLILVCDVSFQAPVGMLDVDATFSFIVGNFCPDLFVLNCLDGNPELRFPPPPYPATPTAITTCEVRFRDGDSTCGQSCDPQTCSVTPVGLDCVPGADVGVSTTVTCTSNTATETAFLDCDFDPLTVDTECTFIGDTLGATPVTNPTVPDLTGGIVPGVLGAFAVSCLPPILGGLPGAVIECSAVTTDGDADCNKVKRTRVNCPGVLPCDTPPFPDICDDANPCTADLCDNGTGIASCDYQNLPDTTPCDPGFAIGGECFSGTCVQFDCGSDGDCEDGNQCTATSCLPDSTCERVSLPSGAVCDLSASGAGDGICESGKCIDGNATPCSASQALNVGCATLFNESQPTFASPLTVQIDAPIVGGKTFSATFDGLAVVSEFVLDTLHDLSCLGVPRLSVNELFWTIQVRSGATGSDVFLQVDVSELVPGFTEVCLFDGSPCQRATDCAGGFCGALGPEILVDLPVVSGVPNSPGGCDTTGDCFGFTGPPTSPSDCDCSPCAALDAAGSSQKLDQCIKAGFCQNGDLLLPLEAQTETFTADSSGEVLFGWADQNLPYVTQCPLGFGCARPFTPDGCYLLSPDQLFGPALLGSSVSDHIFNGIQSACVMAEPGGICASGEGCLGDADCATPPCTPTENVICPTPDSGLVSCPIY
jgi:hypothetical protein